jgi:carbon monoxide dehydrogenase subunit G
MRLHNEFTVAVPIERAWPSLLDIERVAACLPGASIDASTGDGGYRGSMKVKLGPITTTYRGTARLEDVDDDTHTAAIAVEAKEERAHGSAAAVITNQLFPEDGGTRVVADTEVTISGRPAQFGRGIFEDVAASLLTDFAARLERELAGDATAPARETEMAPAPPEAAGALDLSALIPRLEARRLAAAVGMLVLLLVLGRSRRRGVLVSVRYRP